MSIDAPWIALTIDFMESKMFDGATIGCRLAWVALLCYVKAHGRAGRAKVRQETLARDYKLSLRSVSEMLERAQKCADDPAIIVAGDHITVCKWPIYQRDKVRGALQHLRILSDCPTTAQSAPTITITNTKKPPYPLNGGAPAKERAPRQPDPIWDSVCEVFKFTPATKKENTRVGGIVRDLKVKGATPESIRRARSNYIAKWPNVAATPEAVLKHWDQFAGKTAGDAAGQFVGTYRRMEPPVVDPAVKAKAMYDMAIATHAQKDKTDSLFNKWKALESIDDGDRDHANAPRLPQEPPVDSRRPVVPPESECPTTP
jgi:hypothetical protein